MHHWFKKSFFLFIFFLFLSLIATHRGETGVLVKQDAVSLEAGGGVLSSGDGTKSVAVMEKNDSGSSWADVTRGSAFENGQEKRHTFLKPIEKGENKISSFQVLKTLFALFLVIGVIVGTLYLLKIAMGRGAGSRGGGTLIQVLATSFVGPKKAIAIVKVAGEHLVLGITNSEISFLSKIENPEAIHQIESQKMSEGIPFMKVFEKFSAIAKKG
jgi:flagellar biogenesis protein FliO